ncbi:MAG: M20/M25/M40 family metallo-hydrolase [Acidobacteriota bacterium]|nr:M20/M25/M40 family metallo-hydrolase [Acidobacteriota bacterium]
MIRKLLNLSLVLTLAIAALAQQPVATPNTPSVERLRAHIEYLASDKLEGRRTGSSGANLAAEYIAREFARYGLRRSIGYDTPGMSHFEADSPRRYMQQFPYVSGVDLGKNNSLTYSLTSGGAQTVELGRDWMPLGLSSSSRIENAAAVFVGYGITDSELKYDDYQAGNTAGRIAIALSGTPDGDNPHGKFAKYDDVRWKAIAARNAGARALIIIAREQAFKDDRLAQLHYDHGAGDAGLPVVAISRSVAAKLFEANGIKNFEDFVEQLSKAVAQQGTKEIRGYSVTTSNSFDLLNATKLTISTDIVRPEVSASNVVGILDGSDPTLKNEAIVIGAHYDHLGRGGEGSLAPREGEIHHGADDNASGVAGVLELARIFSAQRPRPHRTIVFMAFSGEEEGLLGSNYYVNHPIIPLANTVAMINMDMIGRMKDNKMMIGGVGTADQWRPVIEVSNPSRKMRVTAIAVQPGEVPKDGQMSDSRTVGVPIVTGANGRTIVSLGRVDPIDLTLTEDGYGPSDHSSFYAKKIPVLFLWTGTHEDYHKPSDTANKINYVDEARILTFAARLIQDIDTNDKRPSFAVAKSESAGRSMGFRVYLGTIPNYADSNDGLLLDGVRDDSPAAKAGLKAGDRIVKLAGRDVRNVYDYTYALGELKAGQEYEVELLRGSDRLKLKITPEARK